MEGKFLFILQWLGWHMQLDEHEMLSETAAAISDPLTFFSISMSIINCMRKCREN